MDFVVNWTLVISVASVSLAAMGTLIKIFGSKKSDPPGESPVCKEHQTTVVRLEKDAKEATGKAEALKEVVSGLQQEVAVLKSDSKNLEKTVDDMKVAIVFPLTKLNGIVSEGSITEKIKTINTH